jgi:hypothetical protein
VPLEPRPGLSKTTFPSGRSDLQVVCRWPPSSLFPVSSPWRSRMRSDQNQSIPVIYGPATFINRYRKWLGRSAIEVPQHPRARPLPINANALSEAVFLVWCIIAKRERCQVIVECSRVSTPWSESAKPQAWRSMWGCASREAMRRRSSSATSANTTSSDKPIFYRFINRGGRFVAFIRLEES